jgi:hypothetical protein
MTMGDRVRYRPSGDWSLEARDVPSHVAAHLVVPIGLHAIVGGRVATVVQQGVDTRFEQAKLTGTGRAPAVGPVRVTGGLNAHFVDVIGFPDQGTLTFTAARQPGALTLNLTGPYADLAPTTPKTIHFTFTVAKATGRLAPYAGLPGTADLTIVTRGPSPFNPSHTSTALGTFVLVLTLA